jgi:hypothetical protein
VSVNGQSPGQREGSEGGQRTYDKTQTDEEVLPAEVVFSHIAISGEACVSWDNDQASNRGEYRSERKEDRECCYEVFFVVWQLLQNQCAVSWDRSLWPIQFRTLKYGLETHTPTALPSRKIATHRDKNEVVIVAPSPNKPVNNNVPLNATVRPNRSEPR